MHKHAAKAEAEGYHIPIILDSHRPKQVDPMKRLTDIIHAEPIAATMAKKQKEEQEQELALRILAGEIPPPAPRRDEVCSNE